MKREEKKAANKSDCSAGRRGFPRIGNNIKVKRTDRGRDEGIGLEAARRTGARLNRADDVVA